MQKILIISSLLYLLIIVSCDRKDCTTKNEILKQNSPLSLTYFNELTTLIEENKNLRYWIKSYYKSNNNYYLILNIQNDNICAVGHLLIKSNNNKMKNLLAVEAKSYIGAELIGLNFSDTIINKKGYFVYINHESFRD
jgi:hypothetical protein